MIVSGIGFGVSGEVSSLSVSYFGGISYSEVDSSVSSTSGGVGGEMSSLSVGYFGGVKWHSVVSDDGNVLGISSIIGGINDWYFMDTIVAGLSFDYGLEMMCFGGVNFGGVKWYSLWADDGDVVTVSTGVTVVSMGIGVYWSGDGVAVSNWGGVSVSDGSGGDQMISVADLSFGDGLEMVSLGGVDFRGV